MNRRALIDARLDHWLSPDRAASDVLFRAMRHAVFGGGKRLRPQLLLMVADACGATPSDLELSLDAACAIELIHCASLVHDDLPCFDDADTRRGQKTVHVLFGEPIAILTGDALITLAFEILGATQPRHSRRAIRLCHLLAKAAGSSEGLIGGQSMESDADFASIPEAMARYHAMKTAALFRVAAEAGAISAGAATATRWGNIGHMLGLVYQLADDVVDVYGDSGREGKPMGQDSAHQRPNAVLAFGPVATRKRMVAMLNEIRAQIQGLTNHDHELMGMIEAFTNSYDAKGQRTHQELRAYAHA